MATVPEKLHIESTADTCGGKPRIAGTRIRVQDIVVWIEAGRSPDEIVASYAQLTLADVYAALAYYHDNRTVIDGQIRQDDEMVLQMRSRSGPGLLAHARGQAE